MAITTREYKEEDEGEKISRKKPIALQQTFQQQHHLKRQDKK
jgi:hypothetical protein